MQSKKNLSCEENEITKINVNGMWTSIVEKDSR